MPATATPPQYRAASGEFAESPVKATSGTQTGVQKERDGSRFETSFSLGEVFGSLQYCNGGTLENPMNFPGWGELYTGSYATYRWMLQHPILQLVRSIAVGPILSSSWDFQAVKINGQTPPDAWVQAVKEQFEALRPQFMDMMFVPGRDMGWAATELVWEYRNSLQRIVRLKALNHDISECLRDKYGTLTGVRNYVPVDQNMWVDLATPWKAAVFTFDQRYDDPYGRSWLENVRATGWRMWLDAAQQLQRIGSKISGTVTIVTSPAGTFPGPNGPDGKPTQISYRENAVQVIKALATGAAGAWFPSLGLAPDSKGNIDAMKVLAELVGKSLTNIEVVDHSGNSQALEPILKKMQHAESLMFAAGLRSARTGLEGEHGTKAEAGVHMDSGTVTAEVEDERFAASLQPTVDSFLALNFGERARGTVRIKPNSLIDRKKQAIRVILTALLNDSLIAQELVNTLNMDDLIDSLDIPRKGTFSGDNVLKRAEEQAKKPAANASTNPEKPDGGRPAKGE